MPSKSKIEWTEFTSNPIKGKCLHNCWYCYAERMRQRFGWPEEISWHPKELVSIVRRKKPSTYFLGSMHDIFGDWIPGEWIQEIIDTTRICNDHTFLFLTKNPARYVGFEFPMNCYLGATLTNPHAIPNEDFAPLDEAPNHVFMSFEPLLEEFKESEMPIPFEGTVIIGAMTGRGAKRPQKEWVLSLINQAKSHNCKVFLKDNLMALFPDLPRLRETEWHIS
jgi:protein gp37